MKVTLVSLLGQAQARRRFWMNLLPSVVVGLALLPAIAVVSRAETVTNLEAVDDMGVSTWNGSFPIALTGVVLTDPGEMLDATPDFLPWDNGANAYALGGHWQVAALLFPALGRAKEKAKVLRVHAELYGIGMALQMYSMDNQTNPPVRVNCNTDLREDWCELPTELAIQGYLPHGPAGCDADIQDVFNPGHTYKYAAAGPQLLNGSPTAPYKLWVPTNAPADMSSGGNYFTDPKTCPVSWVLWSLGPQPNSAKSLGDYAPLSSDDWYCRTGDSGVIVRFSDQNGNQFASP
jgi:hypothetical protein